MQGSFVKKRGSTWTAYYYVPDSAGKRLQRTKGGFGTREEAQRFLSRTVISVQTGDYVQPSRVLFGEYLKEQWLPLMKRSIRPSTWSSYESMIDLHVLPTLGGIQIQKLNHNHLDRLYAELLESGKKNAPGGLAPKTVRSIHNMVHKALRDAQRKQVITRNVAEAADPPRISRSGPDAIKVWNAGQVGHFLAGMEGHRLAAAFTLAATTGMRRGEVLGVRWSDIDFQSRRLSVQQTVVSVNYKLAFGTPKTSRGRRMIALDVATLAALQRHRHHQLAERVAIGSTYIDHDLVFPKVDGSPTHPDYFSQTFERSVARLGLPRIRLHDLRHTYATLSLSAGVPAVVVSRRLGHSNPAFTLDVYTHTLPEMMEEAADQVAALIFPSNGGTLLPGEVG